jgi:AraC-like DNA-binding protein
LRMMEVPAQNVLPDAFQSAGGLNATASQIVVIMRRSPQPDWAIDDVANARCHTMVLAVSGRAIYRCEGQEFNVRRGQILFFPKGVVHSGHNDPKDPWSYFFAIFDLLCHDRQTKEALLRLPYCSTPENAQEALTLFSEMERLWARQEAGYWLRCRSILLQLLYIHVRCGGVAAPQVLHADKLAAVVAAIHANPGRNYSLQQLADMANLSLSRFRTLFKAYTGQSVICYQNRLRINKAKNLLLSGECSVREAAREVGIHDHYYFSRLFKSLTGHIPSYYRNQ